MDEIWKDVIGFEGLYKVSNLGRVLRTDSGKIREVTVLDSGYLHLHLYKGNQYFGRYLHRLVLEAFKGPCPPGEEGRHLDDDKTNCYLDNLEWGTSTQNKQEGLVNNRNVQTKLTPEQVLYLRALPSRSGISLSDLASSWNVSEVTLHKARSGRTYKHVKEPL